MDLLKQYLNHNKRLLSGYILFSVVIYILIFYFFHKDFNSAYDVIVVYDLSLIMFYQVFSCIILSFLMLRDTVKNKDIMAQKSRLVGVFNIVVPYLLSVLLYALYIIINFNSFVELYLGVFQLSFDYYVFTLIGMFVALFIHYFYLAFTFKDITMKQKLFPLGLFGSYIVIYLITGLIFDLTVDYDVLGGTRYFEILQVYEFFLLSVMAVIGILLGIYTTRLYKDFE